MILPSLRFRSVSHALRSLLLLWISTDFAITAYPSEILPFHTRQKGLSVCNFCNGLALMFNSFVNPIAMEAIGWKYYLVYVSLLFVYSIIIYLFFAETRGHTLEDIADIFEGPAIASLARRSKSQHQEHPLDIKEPPVSEVEDISA